MNSHGHIRSSLLALLFMHQSGQSFYIALECWNLKNFHWLTFHEGKFICFGWQRTLLWAIPRETMKLWIFLNKILRYKTYTNRKLRQWGVWNYWDLVHLVHVLNVRRHEIRRIWVSSYLEFLEGNFKQSFYIVENMTINIKVCVYNLCLTLPLGHKLLYLATGTFLKNRYWICVVDIT